MFRLLVRAFSAIFFTTRIVAEVAFFNYFGGQDKVKKMRATRRRWAKKLFPKIGIKVKIEGQIPDGQCIIVANHRSYLDPLLILRDVDALPVAKSEVGDWPVLGFGAKLSGVILLDRQSKSGGMATLRAMTAALKKGESIIIFPEGTTSAGRLTLPFLKGAFQLAVKNKVAVVPVALIFENEEDFWIGEESFASHAGRRFREKTTWMQVCYGPVLRSEDAEKLMAEAKKWVDFRLEKGA